MLKPPIAQDEASRLQTLESLAILDTPPEERFDRYTRLARRLFGVPIALVSMVDRERQWFKSRQGLEASETPREISFCGHSILSEEILVVSDAARDDRFADNPLVTEDPNIRFYAGAPLSAADGSKLGTLCIIDREPRTLDEDDLVLLRDLGKMVEDEFTSAQLANRDELTGISNRRAFRAIAEKSLALCRQLGKPASLLFFDLDGFKQINDQEGHAEGDRVLVEMSQALMDNFRDSDVVARLGGDEFCVLLTGTPDEHVSVPLTRLEEQLRRRNALPGQRGKLRYSVGVVHYDPARHGSIDDLLQGADERMYEHKRERQAKPRR